MAYKIGKDKTPPKRDIDWTNSETFGYVGSERSGHKMAQIGGQKEEFMRIMKEDGKVPGDIFTRKDIIRLRAKYPDMQNPSWLIGYRNKDGINPYKIAMATYILPKLEGVTEVVDVFSKIDKVTLERILTPNEHQALKLRYGIDDGVIRTFKDIGVIMDYSTVRTWQLNQRALIKIEEYSGDKISVTITDKSRKDDCHY